MQLHVDNFLSVATAAVTNGLSFARDMVAYMISEPPMVSCSLSEKLSEDTSASQHAGDAESRQDFNETQASPSVSMNLESVLPFESTNPATTITILDEQSSIPSVPVDAEPVLPTDQTTRAPSVPEEQPSTATAPEMTGVISHPSVDEQRQDTIMISPRNLKRRASSRASSLESMISHEPPTPSRVRWSTMSTSSSTLVASESQSLGRLGVKPPCPVHDDAEKPASKRPREEATPEERWVKKVLHSTRRKLSGLRPRNYRYRFRKEIRPALSREISISSNIYGY